MLKTNRNLFVLSIIGLVGFLYILHWNYFENRLSLYIQLKGCDYPWELENLEIEKRRRLFIDELALASFTLKKSKLKKWLLDADFEMVKYMKNGEVIFVYENKDLPNNILEGNLDFVIQFLHLNQERTSVEVDCFKDSTNAYVSLRYNPT